MNIPTITETEIITPLTIEERSLLIDCESKIDSARNQAEEAIRGAGEALHTISEQKLYRSEHRTFDAYLRAKWNISRSRAYQLIDARNTYRLLVHTVDIPSEAVAREFSGMTDEQKIEAGAMLAETGKPITIKAARKAAAKASPEKAAAQAKRQAAQEAKALLSAEKIKSKREKAEAKAFAKSEKTRMKREAAEAKQKAKEDKVQAVLDAKSAKATATALQRPSRGGLAATIAKTPEPESNGSVTRGEDWIIKSEVASKIEKWWKKNEAKCGKDGKGRIVEKICALFS